MVSYFSDWVHNVLLEYHRPARNTPLLCLCLSKCLPFPILYWLYCKSCSDFENLENFKNFQVIATYHRSQDIGNNPQKQPQVNMTQVGNNDIKVVCWVGNTFNPVWILFRDVVHHFSLISCRSESSKLKLNLSLHTAYCIVHHSGLIMKSKFLVLG